MGQATFILEKQTFFFQKKKKNGVQIRSYYKLTNIHISWKLMNLFFSEKNLFRNKKKKSSIKYAVSIIIINLKCIKHK